MHLFDSSSVLLEREDLSVIQILQIDKYYNNITVNMKVLQN